MYPVPPHWPKCVAVGPAAVDVVVVEVVVVLAEVVLLVAEVVLPVVVVGGAEPVPDPTLVVMGPFSI